MNAYYQHWVDMVNWRLLDAVRLVCEYSTLIEGHEDPKAYSIALTNNTNKCRTYFNTDAKNGLQITGLEWVEFGPENYSGFEIDENGNPVDQISYIDSYVDKKEFIQWAINKKFNMPDEFRKLVDNKEDPGVDKNAIKMISAAVRAGAFCASQGVDVKKEQLQDELGMHGPSFEDIWKEVPKKYKQPGGRPKKVIEKIIDAAVFTSRFVAENRLRIPKEKLKEMLDSEKKLDKIDLEYVEMIKVSIDTFFEEEY